MAYTYINIYGLSTTSAWHAQLYKYTIHTMNMYLVYVAGWKGRCTGNTLDFPKCDKESSWGARLQDILCVSRQPIDSDGHPSVGVKKKFEIVLKSLCFGCEQLLSQCSRVIWQSLEKPCINICTSQWKMRFLKIKGIRSSILDRSSYASKPHFQMA